MALALKYFDGFDDLGTYVGYRYAGQSTSNAVAGRFGGYALRGQSSGVCETVCPAFSAAQTVFVCFAWYTGNTESHTIAKIYDGTTVHCYLKCGSDQKLSVYRGDNTLLGTGSVQPASSWIFIEFGVKIDNSVGEVYVRINGNTVDLSLTNQDTQNGGNATADKVSCIANSDSHFTDDFSVWSDSAGGSPSTMPPGETKVVTKGPNSDDTVQFSRSTGATNYGVIDEILPNEDTDYTYSLTNGHKDLLGFADFVTTGKVKGVSVAIWHRKDDADARTIKSIIKTGGGTPTEAYGVDTTLGSTLSQSLKMHLLNPETSAAWADDASDLNASQIGYTITS